MKLSLGRLHSLLFWYHQMKGILKISLFLVLAFFVTSVGAVLWYRWFPVRVTPLMVIRAMEGNDSLGWQWRHEWVDLQSMSPNLPLAVMASEDQRFLQHQGFDFEAIREAVDEARSGGRRRGASTISQQTAKNVFLWPSSSWLRKGFEVYFTVLIEHCWSKQRIMEVYLNSIEMAPGIYGAEAVAQAHFHRSAIKLRRTDCARIAATLPNPLRMSSAAPSRYVKRRTRQILRQMRHLSPFPIAKDR